MPFSSSPWRIAQPRPVNGVPSAPSPPSQENSTAGSPSRLVVSVVDHALDVPELERATASFPRTR